MMRRAKKEDAVTRYGKYIVDITFELIKSTLDSFTSIAAMVWLMAAIPAWMGFITPATQAGGAA